MKQKNDYWVDELLEQPENHHEQPDGSTLYGYTDDPTFLSRDWFFIKKQELEMIWSAKNPFNEHRSVNKSALLCIRPDLYKIAFPFSYCFHVCGLLFDPRTRKDAIYRICSSWIFETLMMLTLGAFIAGIVALCQ